MNEGQIGFVIFGALMMVIAPTSIHVADERRKFVLDSDNPRRAYFRRGPGVALKPRLIAIGVGLGVVWAVVWLTIFLR